MNMPSFFKEKSANRQHLRTTETMQENYNDADSGGEDWKKLEIECICPKCGKNHMMSIHWIGRGMPRKFCNNCRDSSRD